MSAANPFFGQSVISIAKQSKEIVASFPNWGMLDEAEFIRVLTARLVKRGIKPGAVTINRLQQADGVSPTYWTIKIVSNI